MKVVRSHPRQVHIDCLEKRWLLAASIQGSVWNDADGDGVRNAGEQGLPGWVVFLDQNRNRKRDAGEINAITTTDGSYVFSGLAEGTYYVSQEWRIGWEQTSPGLDGSLFSAVESRAAVAVDRQVSVALTTTAAMIPVEVAGIESEVPAHPADVESGFLIRHDQLRADPRFAGIEGQGYSIAILDTGIDLDHPFFGPDNDGNGAADRIVYQYDFADNDPDATDVHGHGSNVTSIAASQDPTIRGMAPGASIISLKVFEDGGQGFFGYIESALQWLVANAETYNVAAVNMSLGDTLNHATPQQRYGIDDELAALAAKNVIVVSAGGNDYYKFQSQGVSYPAADPNSLAVGAVYDANVGSVSYFSGAADNSTAADRIASFSQRSLILTDVFAPGAFITGANHGGSTVAYSGTSQAAPHIAGLAVLAQQLAVLHTGERLTPAEFRTLLRDTAVQIYDGDDENDNVTNTNANYPRVDALAMAEAIYSRGATVPYGYTVELTANEMVTRLDFGNRILPMQPGVPDLQAISDTGYRTDDNITSFDNSSTEKRLQFAVGGIFAGATVSLYANGTFIGSVVAPGIGSVIVSSNGIVDLNDGVYQITARQQLPGETLSSQSLPLPITIDTIAPIRPSAPDLQSSSDSGASATDNITNISRPLFDVQASEASILRLSIDGSLTQGVTRFATTTGSYSLNIAGSPTTFSPQQLLSPGIDPYALAVADMNNDGKADLLSCNAGSRTLSVHLSNGDGSFRSPVKTNHTLPPHGVAVADFDIDGKLDVVISANAVNYYVLFGNGDGTFSGQVALPTTLYSLDVTAGDVNGDGKPDVIAAERNSNTVRIFLGHGDGTFATGKQFAAGGTSPFDPQLADMNRDGKTDIVVSNHRIDTVTVLLGNGDGNFQGPRSVSVADNPTGLALGDYDGDGILDVVVTCNGAHVAQLLRGVGDGTLLLSGAFPLDFLNTGGTAADFNRDGNLDFATTASSEAGGSALVLFGNGDGTLQPFQKYAIGRSPFALVSGDLDQ